MQTRTISGAMAAIPACVLVAYGLVTFGPDVYRTNYPAVDSFKVSLAELGFVSLAVAVLAAALFLALWKVAGRMLGRRPQVLQASMVLGFALVLAAGAFLVAEPLADLYGNTWSCGEIVWELVLLKPAFLGPGLVGAGLVLGLARAQARVCQQA